ncbi:MAG TPA: serine protease [Gemmataceae bacterium]|nr:serine protease [Gemmataceae bacterium]
MTSKQLAIFAAVILVAALPAYLVLSRTLGPKHYDDVPIVADVGETENKKQPAPNQPLSTEELAKQCKPSVAVVKGKFGHGSGFLLSSGVVCTNAHVINLDFEEDIRLHFPSVQDKKHRGPYKAKFIWADRKRDIAYLQVDCNEVPALELAEFYEFRSGQEVLAVGNPGLGDGAMLENALSRGMMSTIWKSPEGPTLYQLNIAVNPGNSGGPVIDSLGRVLGMITAKTKDREGIAFAVMLEDLRDGMLEAQGQSNEATPDLVDWFKANTVLSRMIYIGDLYLRALETYTKAMDTAMARGLSPNEGLRAAEREMADDVKRVNRMFAEGLEINYQSISKSPFIVATDMANLRRMMEVCKELRTLYDKPHGTVQSYRQRKDQLRKEFESLVGYFSRHDKPPKSKKG